jgi:hypothetical protein
MLLLQVPLPMLLQAMLLVQPLVPLVLREQVLLQVQVLLQALLEQALRRQLRSITIRVPRLPVLPVPM